VQPHYAEARHGDVRHSMADVKRAEMVLGWRPEIDFHDGLQRTVEWYRTLLSASR
jgi:nucleoside-diphosphate-sugar epimerase